MKKMIALIACMLVLVLSLTACSQAVTLPEDSASLSGGGVLILRVNPEIAVEYDTNGLVTGIVARNDDALAIIAGCEGLIGQPARDAVVELVTRIGEAGYFVEEVEGNIRRITLEIEPGSALPSDRFLDEVVQDVRNRIEDHDWTTPLVIEDVTDYGTQPTDPVEPAAPQPEGTDYGKTDYNDTNYGPNNDGITDYGKTDYHDTDYGTQPTDPVEPTVPQPEGTDYGTQPTDPVEPTVPQPEGTDYGKTDYDDTDYGTQPTDPVEPTVPQPEGTDYGITDYEEGETDYDEDTDYGY